MINQVTISSAKHKSVTKQSLKSASISKNSSPSKKNAPQPPKPPLDTPKAPTINSITKQNYDIMHKKANITEIAPLSVKYVLKCVQGRYKGRFLYITTHKQGQLIGAGDVKQYGLTLQIEGAGLADRHIKLKFNGLNKFYLKDCKSEAGTWVKINKQGVKIRDNEIYIVGQFKIRFQFGADIQQIQELCHLYHADQISDLLIYNNICDIVTLEQISYEKFKDFPFSKQIIQKLQYMLNESKIWFDSEQQNKIINMYFLDPQNMGFSQQIGWTTKRIYKQLPQTLKQNNQKPDYLCQITKGRLFPTQQTYARIAPQKNYQLKLHDQFKMGELTFQLNRFNVGAVEDIGFRQTMQDCFIMEQDVGGSEWKLISLFAVVDGYGGDQCMQYVKNNLVRKVREWTPLLDEAGDLNQMLKLLMGKTYYQMDYQFYNSYGVLAQTCGATILTVIIIDSKMYAFNLGDNKGYLHRDSVLYQLNLDHIPGRADEKNRIQSLGGFVQFGRLQGKCTLSRALGQFQYKHVSDYENTMKGKLKSKLSCVPEVVCLELNPSIDDFVILSTDGILENMNIAQMSQNILQRSRKMESEESVMSIVSAIVQNCKILNQGCDNMAVILIFLRKGKIGSKNSF